jgi:hypothetical protein
MKAVRSFSSMSLFTKLNNPCTLARFIKRCNPRHTGLTYKDRRAP